MGNYKPTKKDIEFAKQIYDNVVLQQVYNPFQLIEAAKKLFGEDMNWRAARQKLFSYFTYEFKGFDETETALPLESETLSVNNDNQSHSEEDTQPTNLKLVSEEEITKPKRGRKSNKK